MSVPEGVTRADIEDHAVTLRLLAELINGTSDYLTAADGSEEEGEAERRLDILAQRIAGSEKASGSVLLALASLVVSTGDQERVQEWLNNQTHHIAQALADE